MRPEREHRPEANGAASTRSMTAGRPSTIVAPQLPLDTEPTPPVAPPDPAPLAQPPQQTTLDGSTLDERFERWLADHEHVMLELVHLARQWKAAGHDRCSVSLLVERARWELGLRSRGSAFALDNSLRSRMGREIIRRDPDLGERFFEFRRLTSRAGA